MSRTIENNPLLSIRLMTYNHVDFIEKALQSIDMQKTNFRFEVVIGDDFSTDGNLEKIKSFKFSNTNITVNLLNRVEGDSYSLLRRKNGRLHNLIDILNNCKGKYIALLDGDDYWTDPLKLQKQVDFMEANPDFSICFHRANLLKEDATFSLHPIPETSKNGKFIYADLLRDYNFITTASVLFRKPTNFNFPDWFTKVPFGDLALYKMISKGSFIKCLDEVMSVYRIHEEGFYSKLTSINRSEQYLLFYSIIFPELNNEEHEIVKKKWCKLIKTVANLKTPNSNLLRHLMRKYLKMKYSLKG